MSKEVFLYISMKGINQFNNTLIELPVEDSLLSKVVRVFSSSKYTFSPINDTGNIYYWKNINWSCDRKDIQIIIDILSSLNNSEYFLCITDKTSSQHYCTGSICSVYKTLLRQGITPFVYKYIQFHKEE